MSYINTESFILTRKYDRISEFSCIATSKYSLLTQNGSLEDIYNIKLKPSKKKKIMKLLNHIYVEIIMQICQKLDHS